MRLQPLIEQSSTLGVYVYGKGRAWLYAKSNVFPTRMKSRDILGSIFIHSRRYHLGIFFRKEAAFSASLLQKGFLSEHESKTLCTWEVSSLDDSELSMLFQILDDQVSRCTEDSFVPQALQNTLFSMMCGWYGVPFWLLTQERIEGKNCVQNQLLQDQVRKNRREKLFHDLTTSFAQWSCTPFLQQKSDVVCIHPTYATQVSVWSKTKREMCTNILSTLKRVQTKLDTCFVAEHGWIVESSNQIETQMKIQLTNKNWSPNISILVLGMRDFFDSLFMGVSYKRTIQNKASWGRLSDSLLKTMKPIYPDAKSLPGWWPAGVFVPELRKTGGHNWVYNTEESQEGFACAIVEQFQQWSLVHSHIESYEET